MFEGLWRRVKSGLSLSLISGVVFGAAGFLVTVFGAFFRGVVLSVEDLLFIPAWFGIAGFLVGATYSLAISLGVKDGKLGRARSALLGFLTGPALAAALFVAEGVTLDGRFVRASLILGGVAAGVSYLLSGFVQGRNGDGDAFESETRDAISPPNPLDSASLEHELGERVPNR